MDETLEQIASYLRGMKAPMRSDDPRQWAEYLDTVVQPALQRLAAIEAKKPKKDLVSA